MIDFGSYSRSGLPQASASGLRVTLGACPGAILAGDVVPGDVFRLHPDAGPATLSLAIWPDGPRVAPASATGRPGAPVAVTADHRLLAEDGEAVTVLTLDAGAGALLLPLAPLARDLGYTLAQIRPPAAASALPLPARIPAALARGTTLVLACGTPRPVERLAPGDLLLTRDAGGQPLRALLPARVRAAGEMAPVVVAPGTIGNAGELALSPWHRLLLWQAPTAADGDGAERFVQARRLVDGDRIRQRDGGYVDYFAPVLDGHEVLYAEGMPIESLCLTRAVADRLPPAMRAALPADLGWHRPRALPEVTAVDLAPFRR